MLLLSPLLLVSLFQITHSQHPPFDQRWNHRGGQIQTHIPVQGGQGIPPIGSVGPSGPPWQQRPTWQQPASVAVVPVATTTTAIQPPPVATVAAAVSPLPLPAPTVTVTPPAPPPLVPTSVAPLDPNVVRIQQQLPPSPQSPPTSPLPPTSGCLSLSTSKRCPSFATNYLIPSNFQYQGLVNVTSVESFDLLIDYLTKEQDIEALRAPPYNCTKFTAEVQPRFRVTIVCRQVLADTTVTSRCPPRQPKNVCKSTCITHAEDWDKRISQPNICPVSTRNPIRDLCDASAFSGTGDASDSCITGALNEKSSCGFVFPQQKQVACDYCRTNKDACCSSLPSEMSSCQFDASRSSNNTAAPPSGQSSVLAIVLFSLAAVLVLIVLGFLVFCLIKRRRKSVPKNNIVVQHPNFNQPPLPTSNNNYMSSASTASHMTMTPPPPQPPPPPPPMQAIVEKTTGQGSTYVAMFTYKPSLQDELELEIGDLVQVYSTYDDGWGYARHVNPKTYKSLMEGAVPMVCIQRKQAWNVNPPPQHYSGESTAATYASTRSTATPDSMTLPSPPIPPPSSDARLYTAPEPRRASLLVTKQEPFRTGVVRSGTVRMQNSEPVHATSAQRW